MANGRWKPLLLVAAAVGGLLALAGGRSRNRRTSTKGKDPGLVFYDDPGSFVNAMFAQNCVVAVILAGSLEATLRASFASAQSTLRDAKRPLVGGVATSDAEAVKTLDGTWQVVVKRKNEDGDPIIYRAEGDTKVGLQDAIFEAMDAASNCLASL